MKIAVAVATILMTMGLSGCWSFRKKAVKSLPPLTAPTIGLPPAPMELPPEATGPIEVESPPAPPEVVITKPESRPHPEAKPAKPASRPPAPRPAAAPPAPASTPPPEPVVEVPVTQPPPPPQLGEIISDQRLVELRSELAMSLERARAALTLAARRSLTRRQRETAERVRTFIRQAEEARSRDISTAVQLARRADLLAQDMTATFK